MTARLADVAGHDAVEGAALEVQRRTGLARPL